MGPLIDLRRNSMLALLSALLSLPALSVDAAAPMACNSDGRCPGLGQAFYLPSTNILEAKANANGHTIFKNALIGGCASLEGQSSSFRSFKTYETASKLTEALNTAVDAKAGIPTAQVNIGATVSGTTQHTSVKTEDFKSVVLNIELVNQLVNFNMNSTCLFPDNIDPNFQAGFEALALPDPAQAGESFTWASYQAFLSNWGSHVQVQQQLGSRVQQWVSSKVNTNVTTDVLQAKACLNLESTLTGGWAAQPCAAIDQSKRIEASQTETNDQRYILGGTTATRNALIQKFDETNLNAFIATASQGDEPIGFSYLPIWSVLQEVYRGPCGRDGKGSAACNNLQRAMTLQAAYEGFSAYACDKQLDGRQGVIQTMLAQGPDSLGIYYFACHQSKTGCRENSDCSLKPAALGMECYCEGPSCIDSTAIPGTPLQRNFVRGKTEYDFLNSNKGVNASCEDKIASCNCDEGWAGGVLERNVWDQALSGTGLPIQNAGVKMANDQKVTSLTAVTDSTPADPAFYAVHVDVGTQLILNKAEANRAEKAARAAEARGDARHDRVVSNPAGIDCPGVCVATFPKGTRVSLSYEENLDHQFVEWTGSACFKRNNSQVTKGKTCVIQSLDEEKRVGAVFKIAPR